ncbi:4Fe-4S binding protein, partial [Escherichia coli]|uniref:4Fe-4S binding protein n=1 Tax=Escherichia coli TaxID=562 RepID=UPI001961747B
FDYADIIVEPNIPFYISVLLTFFVFAIGFLYANRGISNGRDWDILSLPVLGKKLKNLIKSRETVFLLQWANLVIFLFIILAGLFGNPNGGENFSIIVVWILWFALVEYTIFFAGRTWCTMCPMPVLGEWFTRKRVVGVNRKFLSLNRNWP